MESSERKAVLELRSQALGQVRLIDAIIAEDNDRDDRDRVVPITFSDRCDIDALVTVLNKVDGLMFEVTVQTPDGPAKYRGINRGVEFDVDDATFYMELRSESTVTGEWRTQVDLALVTKVEYL